jgi:hypothetical protein
MLRRAGAVSAISQLLGEHAPFATASFRPLVRIMVSRGAVIVCACGV